MEPVSQEDLASLEALEEERSALVQRIDEIDNRIADIKFGDRVSIDLEREIFQILYSLSVAGWRRLDDFTYRDSEFEECSHKLFFDRIHADEEPRAEPSIDDFKNVITGITTVPNGVAAVGSIIHEFLQRNLVRKFGKRRVQAEQEVCHVINIDGMDIKILGHIDLQFHDSTSLSIADFKTMSDDNFKKVLGLMPAGDMEYATLKRFASLGQANAYGIQKSLDGKNFQVLWMSQKDLSFKSEHFIADKEIYSATMMKIINVARTLVKFRNGDSGARPDPAGVMKCNYCRHFHMHCLGRDAVLGGQKTLDAFQG